MVVFKSPPAFIYQFSQDIVCQSSLYLLNHRITFEKCKNHLCRVTLGLGKLNKKHFSFFLEFKQNLIIICHFIIFNWHGNIKMKHREKSTVQAIHFKPGCSDKGNLIFNNVSSKQDPLTVFYKIVSNVRESPWTPCYIVQPHDCYDVQHRIRTTYKPPFRGRL